MSETLEYWRSQAQHWEREYFACHERSRAMAEELGELKSIRDYLLQELEDTIPLLPDARDSISAATAVNRVQQRTAECANGWVGPAWSWPQQRTERREE